MFTWLQRSGELSVARAGARSAAGTLGPVRALSSSACDAGEPSVATAADSTALFAWRCGAGTIQAVERRPSGIYGAVEDVVTSPSGYLNGPALATAPDGTAWLSWLRGDTQTHQLHREARSRKPDGQLGDTLALHSYGT